MCPERKKTSIIPPKGQHFEVSNLSGRYSFQARSFNLRPLTRSFLSYTGSLRGSSSTWVATLERLLALRLGSLSPPFEGHSVAGGKVIGALLRLFLCVCRKMRGGGQGSFLSDVVELQVAYGGSKGRVLGCCVTQTATSPPEA